MAFDIYAFLRLFIKPYARKVVHRLVAVRSGLVGLYAFNARQFARVYKRYAVVAGDA